jgi:hypothetical protein
MFLSVCFHLSIVMIVVSHLVQQKLPTAQVDSLQFLWGRVAHIPFEYVVVDLFVFRDDKSSLEIVVNLFRRFGLVI